jgi:hypothetical protein
MSEEFKIIKDFENYEISNLGNIRNIKTNKILKNSINSNGYKITSMFKNNKFKKHYIHRLIALTFIPNPDKKKCVDHINNNRLDNDINNLRWVTLSENSHNAKLSTLNTSGVKGVYWNKENNKWHAQIRLNCKKYHIGYYEEKEEAIKARREKAKELFGEYMNECEKEITINLNIKTNENIKINLNIIDPDLEELEKEFEELLK